MVEALASTLPLPPTAVLLGASTYEKRADLDNASFARSHRNLRDVLQAICGLKSEVDLYDYFDHSELRTWAEIADDLGPKLKAQSDRLYQSGDPHPRDLLARWPLLIFYIGHGTSIEERTRVRLGLAGSDATFSAGTSLTGEMLAALFNERARGRPHFYFIDACYGGLLTADLQPRENWNGGGVVVHAAARDEEAIATPSALDSVFTGLVVDVLRHGFEQEGPVTSIGLHEALAARTAYAPGRLAPSPMLEVVPSPAKESDVDLLNLPLFENACNLLAPLVLGSSWESDAAQNQTLLKAVETIAKTDRSERVSIAGGRRLVEPFEVFLSNDVTKDAFSLKRAATAMASAHLAFVDVTDHEPAVMLLLGIRAAVTRGVTICSAQHSEYDRVLEFEPFHFREVPLASHGLPEVRDAASRLADRAAAGLTELLMIPQSYQDMPVFEALRNTHGPGETRLQRPWYEYALVLCPFGREYSNRNWPAIRDNIPKAIRNQLKLQGREPSTPVIARTIDLESPRIVSHALYEALRRTQLCIFDLSHWRAGILFELGVRLAVNRAPPICIIEKSQLDDLRLLDMNAELSARDWDAKWKSFGLDSATARRIREQAIGLVDHLEPIVYDPDSDDLETNIAARLTEIVDPFAEAAEIGMTRLVDEDVRWRVWRHANADFDSHASIGSLLEDPVLRDAGRDVDAGQRYLVYPAGAPIWGSIRDAAVERQFMAWMYLQARNAHEELDARLTSLRVELGESLRGFVRSGRAPSWIKASVDRAFVPASARSESADHAPAGDAVALATSRRAIARGFQTNEEYVEAQDAFFDAATDLQAHLDDIQPSDHAGPVPVRTREAASLLAQLWGGAGANARRLDDWLRAKSHYGEGLKVERDERWAIVDSYNLVNHYTASIMAEPGCYDDIQVKLVDDAALVRQQVCGSRGDQWWAWADAGQLSLLAGDTQAAEVAYREYLERGDPGSFATTADVLELLGRRLGEEKKIGVSRALTQWASRLRTAFSEP